MRLNFLTYPIIAKVNFFQIVHAVLKLKSTCTCTCKQQQFHPHPSDCCDQPRVDDDTSWIRIFTIFGHRIHCAFWSIKGNAPNPFVEMISTARGVLTLLFITELHSKSYINKRPQVLTVT